MAEYAFEQRGAGEGGHRGRLTRYCSIYNYTVCLFSILSLNIFDISYLNICTYSNLILTSYLKILVPF